MAIKTNDNYFKQTVKGILNNRKAIQDFADNERKKSQRVNIEKLRQLLAMRSGRRQEEDELPQPVPPPILRRPDPTTIEGMVKAHPLEFRQDIIQPIPPPQSGIINRQKAISELQRPANAMAMGGRQQLESPPEGFAKVPERRATPANYLQPSNVKDIQNRNLSIVQRHTNFEDYKTVSEQLNESQLNELADNYNLTERARQLVKNIVRSPYPSQVGERGALWDEETNLIYVPNNNRPEQNPAVVLHELGEWGWRQLNQDERDNYVKTFRQLAKSDKNIKQLYYDIFTGTEKDSSKNGGFSELYGQVINLLNQDEIPTGLSKYYYPITKGFNKGETLEDPRKGLAKILTPKTTSPESYLAGLQTAKQAQTIGEMLVPDFSKMSEPERIAAFVTMGFSDVTSPISRMASGAIKTVQAGGKAAIPVLNTSKGFAQAVGGAVKAGLGKSTQVAFQEAFGLTLDDATFRVVNKVLEVPFGEDSLKIIANADQFAGQNALQKWISQRAQQGLYQRLKTMQAMGFNVGQAAGATAKTVQNTDMILREVTDDVVNDLQRVVIPRGTQTGAMKFGGLPKGGGEVPKQAPKMSPSTSAQTGLEATIPAKASGETPVKQGYTRVYRGELENSQSYMTQGLSPETIKGEFGDVTGRWFTTNKKAAEAYKGTSGKGVLKYIDVPTSDIEKYRPTGEAGKYLPIDKNGKVVQELAKDYVYLPQDIASKATESVPPVKPPEVPPESPSAIVQQAITPPAQASVPPAGTPPITPPIQTPVTPQPQGARFTMADLQNTDDVIAAIEKPDVWRKVANTPVIKEFMAKFNPSAIANTPEAKYLVGRQVLFDEADQKTVGIMSTVLQKGRQADVFGKAGNNQVIQSGALKGNTVGDIVSNPGKYNLTPKQKEWVSLAQDIEKAKLDFARRNGIDIRELTFTDGGQYASRKIYAKVDNAGNIIDTAPVGRGIGKPGKLTSMEKQRVFATEADAIKAGYYPLPYEEALTLNVKGIMRRVADQKMSEWLLSKIDYRTTGAPQKLIEDSFIAKRKLDQSRRLLAALNRAIRGERVPASTLNSLNNSFPQQASDLKKIIDGVQNKTDVKAQIKALRTASKGMADTYYKDWLKTQGLKARARERAMRVNMGEASVPAPAFQGKIFTGENAREIANTIIRGLDPQLNEALHAVNKVNAISRYFSLAGDISVGGIQLIMLPGQNPVIHAKALSGMVRGIVDPRFIQRYLAKNKAIIDQSPNLIIPTEGATEFTEAMAKGGALGGSSPITGLPGESNLKVGALAAPRLVSKVGKTVLEPFQRGMEDALTIAGIELKKAYIHSAKTPQQMAELDQWINEFRGLTNSRRLGVSPNMRGIETAFILAPQYNRAIAGLLFDLTRGNIRGHRARISLMCGLGALTAMGIAISYALGERDPEEIAKHFVPGSSDFFTWKVAGQRVGPGSKVRSVLNLVGQSAKNPGDLLKNSMENPGLRFVRGNLSPSASTSLDILTGRNYLGEPTRDEIGQLTKTVFTENLLPIWTQSLAMEKGDTSIKGMIIRGGIEFAGGRAYPEPLWSQASELANKYAQLDYGKKKDKLNSLEYKDLLRNHPDLQDIYTRADIDSAYKGDPFQEFLDTFGDEQKQVRADDLDKQAVALRNGFISRSEYDKERGKIRAYYSGASTAIYEAKQNYNPSIYKLFEAKQQPEDKDLSEYLDYQAKLFDESPIPINYDQIQYDLANYIKKYNTKTQKYIQEHETDWIKDLPENAKIVETARVNGLQDESWFDDYYEVLFERPSGGTTTYSGTSATTTQTTPTKLPTVTPGGSWRKSKQ